MLGKTDEQRVTSLLTEAITMLCRNGLSYQHELCVEGLLGITLDKQSVVLVNIKETINLEPDSDDTPQEGAAVAETPLPPMRAFKSPRRTPDSCRPMRPAKRRRSNTSSSSTGVLPDDTAMVTPVQSPSYDSVTGSSVVILDQEETPFDVDAAEIKTEIVEKVECSDYPSLSSGDGYVNQINSGRNRLTETSQYGGHVQSDAATMDDSAATWDFATNSMPTTANTFTGYNESCVTQDVTVLPTMASPSKIEVMRLVLCTPGPFQVVRSLHRKLQRRVSTSGQLLSLLGAMEAAGLGRLAQVPVGESHRRCSTVFYKHLPAPPLSEDANVGLTLALHQIGLTLETYVCRLKQADRQYTHAQYTSIARSHPGWEKLTNEQICCLFTACPSTPQQTSEQNSGLNGSPYVPDMVSNFACAVVQSNTTHTVANENICGTTEERSSQISPRA